MSTGSQSVKVLILAPTVADGGRDMVPGAIEHVSPDDALVLVECRKATRNAQRIADRERELAPPAAPQLPAEVPAPAALETANAAPAAAPKPRRVRAGS